MRSSGRPYLGGAAQFCFGSLGFVCSDGGVGSCSPGADAVAGTSLISILAMVRVAAAFFAAALRARVLAAFFPAARCLRVAAAFFAAARRLRVAAAFLPAALLWGLISAQARLEHRCYRSKRLAPGIAGRAAGKGASSLISSAS